MPLNPSDLRDQLQQALAGSYTLQRELGGGGMSRVFLAEELAFNRQVVVKVLAPDLAHELSADRFAREIRVSSQLQHPNIVPVLSAGNAGGIPYYVMPFVDGESLRARLTQLPAGERLPFPAAVEILRDVLRALSYAHGRGVVHRDIKPENVLLAHGAAVVADFGVAKATAAARTLAPPGADTTLTQAGVSLGTPAYMSPEQAAADPAIDHRADIYAWGILAYELLAGAHPFSHRDSVQALVSAHLVEEPRPLGQAAPHLPPPLAALVMRCLAKSPADRPGSAGEILDSLATPRGGSMSVPRPHRRTITQAAGVLLVAGIAGVAWYGNRTGTPPAAAPAPSARDEYLRGKVRVSSENREDNDAAILSLQRAVAADPEFAAAWATLARAYAIKAFYFAPDSEKKRLTEDGEVAVARALELDPRLGEAHLARGLMLWTPSRRFPHEQAVQAYRQALQLDSTLDEAHHQLAMIYFHVGLLDKARDEVSAALAINPGNTLARFRIGVIHMYRGEFDRAYAIFNSTPLERNPSLWAFQTATALFRLGRESEATALIDRYLRDNPRDEGGLGHSVRAMMLAKAGRRAEAETAIAQSLTGRTFGHFHHTAYNLASAYALLGDPDQAIPLLQDAADNGFPCYPLFASDRQLDSLRKDPRFTAMLAGLKRDWEERRRTL